MNIDKDQFETSPKIYFVDSDCGICLQNNSMLIKTCYR